jgi:uroporphyrinogen decarboxylase
LMQNKVLLGYLDPCALYGSKDDVRKSTLQMLQSFEPGRHIANLGHGLYPDTEVDKVKYFIDTVKNYRYST